MPNPNYDYLQQHPLIEIINVNWGVIGLGFRITFIANITDTTARWEEHSRVIFGGFRDDGEPRNVSIVNEGNVPTSDNTVGFPPALSAQFRASTLETSGSAKGAGSASSECFVSFTGEPETSQGRGSVSWGDFDLKDDDTEEIYHMAIWVADQFTTFDGVFLAISFEFYLEGQDPYPDLP